MLALMKIVETKSALKAHRATLSGRVGFVPTMGALHAGHMALVEAAREASDHVIVSIFVNPTQFGNPEDLEKYPRELSDDLAKLEAAGVEMVFTPKSAEMYPAGADTYVETPRLATMLMGALRPGHFRGVATIVTKLFNLVRPDMAWFGLKDYQQVLVIQQLVRDLELPVEIIGHPTLRDPDGLAMSSRNLRLTPADRAAAPILSKALQEASAWLKAGLTPDALCEKVTTFIQSEPRANLKSVDLRNAETLDALPDEPITQPVVLLLAAEFGGILLIDNAVLSG